MRVAFDARSLHSPTPRGWDRYLLELLARLPARGVEPYLLFEEGKPPSPKHALADHPRISIDARWGVGWEQVALPRTLYRLAADIYHAPAERGIPLAAPCPTLLTLHSLTHHSYRSLVKRGLLTGAIEDYVGHGVGHRAFSEFYSEAQFRAADHIVVPSEFCKGELLSLLGLAASKVTVTRLGLPQAFMLPRLTPERVSEVLRRFGIRQPYALYVGGYERHKNHHLPSKDMATLPKPKWRNCRFDSCRHRQGTGGAPASPNVRFVRTLSEQPHR